MEQYVQWILMYSSETYSPDFISPFSGNDSFLQYQVIDDNSQMSEQTTMWEMDTLKLLKESPEWLNLQKGQPPKVIGPDRATVNHTKNVLLSFNGNVSYIRPEYRPLIDIIGTHATYVDPSATSYNFNELSSNGMASAWCTMCSQEWYRELNMSLGYNNRLLGPRVESGYWGRYQENWGKPQAPAS